MIQAAAVRSRAAARPWRSRRGRSRALIALAAQPSRSPADRSERSIRGHSHLERPCRDLARDGETLVKVDPIMDATVDPRFAGLTRHREIATALIRKLRVEDEPNRS